MHANDRGRQRLHISRAPSGGPLRRPWSRGAAARVTATVVAAGLLLAACGGETSSPSAELSPTFSRADGGDSFAVEKPLTNVGGLLPPGGDGEPWTIVGSVYDPERDATAPATWLSDDGTRWKRHDVERASSKVNESMAAVTRVGDGALAVGSAGDGAASDAAVWRRSGDDWQRVTADAFDQEHEQWAFAAASGKGGTLVAGGESAWGEIRPRLWFSTDGTSWETVDGGAGGPLDATGTETVRAITAFGDGFVAVGSRTVDSEQDGLAWYSPDGRSWEQVDAPDLGGPGRQSLTSLASIDGTLVAGGYQVDGRGDGQPVVWRSSDGKKWGSHSAPLPLHDDDRTNAGDLGISAITVDGDDLVAAGGSEWRPHLWRSSDKGRTWKLLPNPTLLFRDGVSLADVAARGSTVIALGREPSILRLGGSRWEDVTSDELPDGGVQPFASSVAHKDGTTVLVGGRYTAPRGDKRERYVGQVWLRRGGRWAPVESDAFAHGEVVDVAAFKGGFVAVGFEDFGVAAKRKDISHDPLPDGIIWTSKDGKKWKRIAAKAPTIDEELLGLFEDPTEELAGPIAQLEAEQSPITDPPAGGEGTHSLTGVDAIGNGFAAAGVRYDGDVDPIMLTSGDGKGIKAQDTGFGGDGTQQFRDVCVGPDNVIVAVGDEGRDADYDVAVRRRNAKGEWSKATAPDKSFGGPGRQQAHACAASDDGFLVVGSDDRSGNTDARIWSSPDGAEWTSIPAGNLGGAGDQWASAAAAVPGGGWLVGGTDTVEGDGDIALWRVVDGRVTRRDQREPALGGPGQQTVSKIAVDGDHVILVGEDHGRAGVWESDTLDR